MTRPAAPLPVLRAAMRISNAFLLDLLWLGSASGELDYIDTVILVAMVQANVAPLDADPALQLAYATLEALPPDEVRRPISVNALAQSLSLPFETVRRRVVRLREAGRCEITPQGARVPLQRLASNVHTRALQENWALLRTLYLRGRLAGALDSRFAAAAAPQPEVPPMRAAVRLASAYFLRVIERLGERSGDLVTGFVLMAIHRANTASYLDRRPGELPLEPDGLVRDASRAPVPVLRIAAELGMPEPTVRRRVLDLLAEGRCQRTPAGIIVPCATFRRPEYVQLMGENYANLQRLFAGLAQLGAVQAWEADFTAARACGGAAAAAPTT